MDPFSGASRLLAIFVAGLLVGAVSIGYIAPTNLGSDGSTGAVAAPGADGVLVPLPSDAGATGGPADPKTDGGSGVDVGPGGGGAATTGGVGGTTGGAGGTTGGGSGTTGSNGGGGDTGGGDTGGGGGDTGGGGGSAQLSCDRSDNGGATDRGVDKDSIFLPTTVVESGVGAAFLADVKWGMEAVVRRVNSQGGICGRLLDVQYRDDGWRASDGSRYLNTFIEDGAFAIPVGPSSEGLNASIENGTFDKTHTPVVGTDGLIIAQYECTAKQASNTGSCQEGAAQQWVWPVAAATVANARIIAQHAYESGAREFSVVFDKNFRFGNEAALAFNAQVKKLTGSDIQGFNTDGNCDRAFCGIQAGNKSSYSHQVNEWRNHRGDFTALFLEPQTAKIWMGDKNTPPAFEHRYGASQTLFTQAFASEMCLDKCHDMEVWTGFKPFRQRYENDPAVRQYVTDVRSVNNQADVDNQFVEGGYIGMKLLVEAIRAVGPNLTRDRLKAALDETKLSTGLTLTDPLAYSPNTRYVATSMQRWTILHQGTFSGFQDGPVVTDPCPAGGIGTC